VALLPLRLAHQFRERGVLIAEDGPEVLHLKAGLRRLLQSIGDDGAGALLALRAEQRCRLLEFLRAGGRWGSAASPCRKWLTSSRA
jgi:hypothetical protein